MTLMVGCSRLERTNGGKEMEMDEDWSRNATGNSG